MRRLALFLGAALLTAPLPALSQQTSTAPAPTRPPQTLPQSVPSDRLTTLPGLGNDVGSTQGGLSEEQVMRRMARIYEYQAKILEAQAVKDTDQAERLLDLAMTELATLSNQQDVMERARFRELYRTVVTEYERYYGVSDSLLTLQQGDVYQFRADMFAAMDELKDPLLEDVNLPAPALVKTAVPMTRNRLVENSLAYLLRSPDRHINRWLSRAETYFPMIEQILAEEGVPDELKYLAMIESGLVPVAKSWAQAGGMWQFITATGSAYGLQVNSWVDERLDPEKATRAAARHLKDLHQMFGGDWQLALAGYNCSPARIKRAMARAEARTGRKATFWDIYDDIPKETRNYVPMFIATALVASNPEAYGLTNITPGPRYEYDYVPVRGMLSLKEAARLAGTDEATLRALNPELRRNTLPPTDGHYYLRIPPGTYAQFAAGLSNLAVEERPQSDTYTVRRGDTLTKIARQFGVSTASLRDLNGLASNRVQVGQDLRVPLPSYRSNTPVTLASANAMTVRYGARSIRPIDPQQPVRLAGNTPPPTVRRTSTPVRLASSTGPASETSATEEAEASEARAEPAKQAARETRVVYTVRSGDNLTEIAGRYGVSLDELRRWNSLNGSVIHRGQRLYIYTSGDAPTPVAAASSSRSSERVVYRVRRGDNLTEIAGRYGVSVSSLREWNGLRSNTIRTGQRLKIYPGQKAGSAKSSQVVHKVRKGESLGTIARKYGVSVSSLKRWNGLRSNTIRPGQRLKVNT